MLEISVSVGVCVSMGVYECECVSVLCVCVYWLVRCTVVANTTNMLLKINLENLIMLKF